jgi:beta-lactamase superfamily II metal-dependent hydrolase
MSGSKDRVASDPIVAYRQPGEAGEEFMATYRYATYPSIKVLDAAGNQVQHALWGDWVRVDGPADAAGLVPVRVRGVDGFVNEGDLQEERVLEVAFIDVGQGDGCLVVTPDDKKIVIDAGQRDNMYRYLRWRFDFRGGLRTLDAAIITHPDADHYYGFKPLFQEPNLKFKAVLHNGIMEQTGKPLGATKKVGGRTYLTDLIETRADLDAFLADKSRYGQKLYANLLDDARSSLVSAGGDIRMVHAPADPAEAAYLPSSLVGTKVKFRVLGPVIEPDAAGKARLRTFGEKPGSAGSDDGKTKNGHSIVLMLEYGALRILLGGDLNSSAEAFLLTHYTGLAWPPANVGAATTLAEAGRATFGADIAKSCHHGSADFTDVFLGSINAAATVISSGDEESHAHPRSDTLGAVGLAGRGWRPLIFSTELNRSTREDEAGLPAELRRLLVKLDTATDMAEIQTLRQERDALLATLAKRNVTVYGAIQLRTDGDKALLAYKLEKPRTGRSGGRSTLTAWDLYRLERTGGGPLVYAKE